VKSTKMLHIVSWCYNLNIKEGRWTRYMEQHWNYVFKFCNKCSGYVKKHHILDIHFLCANCMYSMSISYLLEPNADKFKGLKCHCYAYLGSANIFSNLKTIIPIYVCATGSIRFLNNELKIITESEH
jgi:hypothetical protein